MKGSKMRLSRTTHHGRYPLYPPVLLALTSLSLSLSDLFNHGLENITVSLFVKNETTMASIMVMLVIIIMLVLISIMMMIMMRMIILGD